MMSQGGLSLGFITGVYYPALLESELSVSMIQTNAFISQQPPASFAELAGRDYRFG